MKNKYYPLLGPTPGYLVVTQKGNFIATSAAIYRTADQPGENEKPVTPDVTIQGMIDNALSNANNVLTKGEVEIFQCMVDSDIEKAAEEEN